jgi:hypothetical protein
VGNRTLFRHWIFCLALADIERTGIHECTHIVNQFLFLSILWES